MYHRFKIILMVLFFCNCSITAQNFKPGIENLNWLTGCWASEENGKQITEHWMKPAGKTMLAMSRTIINEKTANYEFMRIIEDEYGDIYFIANPSGQEETSFKLIKSSSKEVIFENLEHDFPQRVIYRLESEDSLNARIEGIQNGQETIIVFPMKRATCN